MTRQTVCDVCGEPIPLGIVLPESGDASTAVQFAGGDYHDRAECIGAIQAAWAESVAKVKKPKAP